MTAKKILYLDHTAHIGGAELSLLGLLERIDRSRFSPVAVVPFDGPLADRLRSIQVPVHVLALSDGTKTWPLPYVKTVLGLLRLIRGAGIDLVHTNMYFCNRYASVAAKLAHVPHICHVRNILTPDACRHYFLKMSPFLIANSMATQRGYASSVRSWQRSWVIYNGVDVELFRKHSGERSQRPNPYPFVVAQVGRIVPEKGFDTFVEALALVAAAHPEVRGQVVGDTALDGNDQYKLQLQRQVADRGLAEKVTFTGWVEDMPRFYSGIDLLVQPSVAEPFGRTLVEAMAAGVPVIASRAGGALEVVEDGSSGLLVPPGDAGELARAIVELRRNHELVRLLAEGGSSRVDKLFNVNAHVSAVEGVYSRILGS